MNKFAFGVIAASLSLSAVAEQAPRNNPQNITTIAVDIRALQEFTAQTLYQSMMSGIHKEMWLRNMNTSLVKDITTTLWNSIRAGNGFGSEELYIELANKHGNPALAELITNMVNRMTINTPLIRRLQTLKNMGYRIVVCSPIGQTAFEAVRYDKEVQPQLYKVLRNLCSGVPELTTCQDSNISPARVTQFLLNNYLANNTVMLITDNTSFAQEAKDCGVATALLTGHSPECVAEFEAQLARALGREKQFGIN